MIAVDMIQQEGSSSYFITECSTFISVMTPEQLKVDGVAGRYRLRDGAFVFEPGCFWLQELVLQEVMKSWIQLEGSLGLPEQRCYNQLIRYKRAVRRDYV